VTLLADATPLVALAARLHTNRILPFDERHFRVVRPLQGGAFELLPHR
jgi:predicted nucleic acid-binding protein